MADEVDLANDKADAERDRLVGKARGEISGLGELYCVDCGTEIPAARRQANPAARRCIDCQELAEDHSKGHR